jgi:hypothetical protein
VTRALREIAAPFVAAAPAGTRVRTRLRVTAEDAAVLRTVGRHLGSLAGRDLTARVREGRLDAQGKAESRRERKRVLTAQSSSRWAGAITRTSEDQRGLAERNLRAERSNLQARVQRIEARVAVPAAGRSGRLRGYASPSERHGKIIRLHALQARLARVERQLESGSVSVVRGGRALLRKRANLTAAGITSGRRAAPQAPAAGQTNRNGRSRQAQRQPPRWRKTVTATRPPLPAQAAHDRSGPPAERYSLLLSD